MIFQKVDEFECSQSLRCRAKVHGIIYVENHGAGLYIFDIGYCSGGEIKSRHTCMHNMYDQFIRR